MNESAFLLLVLASVAVILVSWLLLMYEPTPDDETPTLNTRGPDDDPTR